MKKLRLFILPLLLAFCAISAKAAVEFTVMVSVPQAVKCTINGTPKELVAGANAFSVEVYTQIQFESVAPYVLTGVTNQAGTPEGVYGGNWNFYPSEYNNGFTYTLAVINLDEIRTGSFTLNIDDPSLVRASLSGYDQSLTLVPGANTVKFDELKEESLSLSSSTGKPLSEVKVNGVKVDGSTYFSIPTENGMTVDVTAAIPDKDVTISFVYNETGKGAIQSVTLDGVAVENFDGNTVKAKAGQEVGLMSNPDFKLTDVKIDNAPTNWTGGYKYSFTVMEDTQIDVAAAPYGKIDFKVIVDNPENIIFYKGYSYYNVVIPLIAGENKLQISETNTTVSWAAAQGCFITSVTVNGEPVQYSSDRQVQQDDVIEFVTGKIVYDQKAAFWIDDRAAATQYFSLEASDATHSRFDLASGYNLIEFYSAMTPFQVSWYSQTPTVNKVYLNGELVESQYPGSTSYLLPVENNSVVKIFLAEEPVECNVTFDVADGLDAAVTRDVVAEVADWRSGFTCFKGTQIEVAGELIAVKVNDTSVEKNSEGKFVFTVENEATAVEILSDGSGVENVQVSADADDSVFNMMGVRLGAAKDFDTLPAGIYIVGGRKVLKK